MKCIRCGGHAVVKRADGDYCEDCSITLDWQRLISLIQDARVETPVAGMGAATTV